MLHIVRHSNKKFDVVGLGRSQEYLLGSKQGYERKSGCIKVIRATMKHCFDLSENWTIFIQDDTTPEPSVFELGYKIKTLHPELKAKKKYQFPARKK